MTTFAVSSSLLRLLLRILQQQQSSFVLQRSENVLQTTEELLQRLGPSEPTLQALTEVSNTASLCSGQQTGGFSLCWIPR